MLNHKVSSYAKKYILFHSNIIKEGVEFVKTCSVHWGTEPTASSPFALMFNVIRMQNGIILA